MKMIFAYFFLSLVNLVALKMAAAHDVFQFMSIRGLAAISLILATCRIRNIQLTNLWSMRQLYRLGLGGGGLGLQFATAHHLPLSMLAITSRTTPIWLASLQATHFGRKIISIFILIAIFMILYPSQGIVIVVSLASTFLLSLSQIQQIAAAKLESPILLPFAPAMGLFLIGLIGTFINFEIADLQPFQILIIQNLTSDQIWIAVTSGLIMTLTYWAAAPLFKLKGGLFVFRIDIITTLSITIFSAFQNGFQNALPYLGLSLFSLFLLK